MSAIKRVAALIAAALIVFAGALAFAAVRYSTREVERGDFVRESSFSGGMVYLNTDYAAMSASNATLTAMDVETGQEVEEGDVVGTYEIEVSDADIVRAENALSQAQEDYAYEKANRQSQIDALVEQGAQAAGADEARALELQAQRASLELERYCVQQEAYIASLEGALSALNAATQTQQILAPMTGVVDSVATAGLAVSPGQTLITMHDTQAALVAVSDPEGELKYGMSVALQLTSRNSNVNVTGTVVSCDNVLPAALRSGVAYIAYDTQEKGSSFSGATATAQTMLVKDVLLAAVQSISYSDGSCKVQILSEGDVVRNRYVNKGFENTSDVWIISGLSEGDKLIVK